MKRRSLIVCVTHQANIVVDPDGIALWAIAGGVIMNHHVAVNYEDRRRQCIEHGPESICGINIVYRHRIIPFQSSFLDELC